MDQVAWEQGRWGRWWNMERCDGSAGVAQNMATWWKDVSICYGLGFLPNPRILIGKVTAELSTVIMSNSGRFSKNGDDLKHPDCKFLHGRCKIEMVVILSRIGDGQRNWEVDSCRHVLSVWRVVTADGQKHRGAQIFFQLSLTKPSWTSRPVFSKKQLLQSDIVIGAVSSKCLCLSVFVIWGYDSCPWLWGPVFVSHVQWVNLWVRWISEGRERSCNSWNDWGCWGRCIQVTRMLANQLFLHFLSLFFDSWSQDSGLSYGGWYQAKNLSASNLFFCACLPRSRSQGRSCTTNAADAWNTPWWPTADGWTPCWSRKSTWSQSSPTAAGDDHPPSTKQEGVKRGSRRIKFGTRKDWGQSCCKLPSFCP